MSVFQIGDSIQMTASVESKNDPKVNCSLYPVGKYLRKSQLGSSFVLIIKVVISRTCYDSWIEFR